MSATVPVGRFAVLNCTTKEVRWFEGDSPFATSHYANAHEDGDTIVVDAHSPVGPMGLTRSDLANYGADGDYNSWFTKVVAVTTRWELDLATGALKEQVLTDISGEFPRINDNRATLEHRFGYFVTQRGIGEWLFDGLAKIDTKTGRTEVATTQGLTAPGEPVFVPREGATDEDDGWLLSVWWDPQLTAARSSSKTPRTSPPPPLPASNSTTGSLSDSTATGCPPPTSRPRLAPPPRDCGGDRWVSMVQ